MALIVQKFGGSSVSDPERIRKVADNVARTVKRGHQVVVVVSAIVVVVGAIVVVVVGAIVVVVGAIVVVVVVGAAVVVVLAQLRFAAFFCHTQ